MIGSPGSIGGAAEGEDDRTDRPAGGPKNLVVSRYHPIGVVDQIPRILEPRSAQRGINVHAHGSARTGAYKLRSAGVTGPSRRGWTAGRSRSRNFMDGGGSNRMMHWKNSCGGSIA